MPGASGTVKQLVNPHPATHEANFRLILPKAMDQLVKDGLFEPDGQGSYRITKKGRQKLAELERLEKKGG